ncbi:DMT family transporter [Aminipila sp.]|uniref:DMT family transporter n=1 Tax=Aminipila sp. TaxID=2060095 RepID=UPI0028A2262F|nr:DMT family transporter [Aminipila sp.]
MKKVGLLILLTAFLFGTMEVALKIAGNGLDSFQLTFLRFIIGGIFLFPFAINEIRKNQTKLELKDYGYLLILGIICIPISMLFFQLGVMHSNASTASVIMCINPLFTMIFAHFMSNETFTKNKLIVLIWGTLGLIFMVRPWDIQEGNTPLGVFFMLIAAATFGLYTVAGKNGIKKIGIMAQTSISFIFGSLVLLFLMILMHKPVLQGVGNNIGLVLYISIAVTGLGYYVYFSAIKNSDATTGSIAFFIKPAIAPVIAVVVLHDKLLWNTYIGIGLILIASYLNIYNKKTEEDKIEQEQIEFK